MPNRDLIVIGASTGAMDVLSRLNHLDEAFRTMQVRPDGFMKALIAA